MVGNNHLTRRVLARIVEAGIQPPLLRLGLRKGRHNPQCAHVAFLIQYPSAKPFKNLGQHPHAAARLEQMRRLFAQFIAVLVQRRNVIENPEGTAVCCHHQILILHLQIMDWRDRQIELETLPRATIIEGDVQPRFCSGIQQPLPVRVFPNRPRKVVIGNAVINARPALAVIRCFVEVGLVIIQLVARPRHIRRCRVMGRWLNHAHHHPFRPARLQLCPVSPAILGQMQVTIIGASPQHPLFMGRFSQRENGGVGFRSQRVLVDRAAGWLERFRVGSRQVRANGLPALPFVGRFKNVVAANINHIAVVGGVNDGVGPGKAVFVLPCAIAAHPHRPGCHQANLFGAMIIPLQGVAAAGGAANRAHKNDVGVVGVDGNVAAFAGTREEAVGPGDRTAVTATRHP